MEFQFTAEEKAFQQQVKHFFERETVYPPGWKPYTQASLEKEEVAFVRGLARRLGERGWLTLSWSREYGGQDAPILAAILAEAVYYYGVMYARDPIGLGILAPTIINFGTPEQKQKHLHPIARGEMWWAQGFTEPNAGSDLASVQLRAEERDDHFLVNGQKIFTSNAHNADWMFFLARTDPQAAAKHRGLSFLLVDMRTPGITVRPLLNFLDGHEFNEVFFEEVRVPKENLVGERNRGFYIAMSLLEFERFASDESCGQALRAFERLVAYAQNRKFRVELRLKLAEMAMELEIARWFYYRNAWLQGKAVPFEAGPPLSKLFISELNARLYQVGMEMLGAYALLQGDSPHAQLQGELGHLYFDAIKDTIGAGTSEIQRNIIAKGLGMPRG